MTAAARFYESPPWRFVVTDLDSVTLTFLDKLATNRRVVRTLNEAMVIAGTVPSDNPEINILHTDGYPFLSEGNRLLYGFRREAPVGGDPWVIRAAGILLFVDDQGGPTVPLTDYLAFDPWQYLYLRTLLDGSGGIPEVETVYQSFTGDDIVLDLLSQTEGLQGVTHLDFPGNSTSWAGTWETTDVIPELALQAGSSVGEALDQLVETGTIDIVIDPVYDPDLRSGIVGQVSVYARAGAPRYDAVFAWDKPSRNVVDISHQLDGRERANNLLYHYGQGGPPATGTSDAASTARYGEYWRQQFFPKQTKQAAVELIQAADLALRKDGLATYTLSPAPERAPIPFVDYDIGDTVPVAASDRARQAVDEMLRVHSIPLEIANDQMEAPAEIVVALYEESA